MYTKLVENHQAGFLVHLFWRSPCPVPHPPPIPVCGRHGPVRARGMESLPHSFCLLPSLLQCTDNEARESAMSLWLSCSQETGGRQAPSVPESGDACDQSDSSCCHPAPAPARWRCLPSPLPCLQIPSNGCHSHFSGCNHLLPWGLFHARSLYW